VSPVLIAPLAAAAVLAVAWGVLALQRWWQRRLVGTNLVGVPSRSDAGVPDILYFTGESCTVCHVAQRPALERLREQLTDVTVREIDVAADPVTARTYRVMTLPTTVVLDREGRTVAVNAGFASETALRDQVHAARRSSLVGAPA